MPSLSPRSHPVRGFTLIELAIVLAIAAILLRVATPGMGRVVVARALSTQAAEFMAALRFARSEAIRRGAVVTLCAAQDAGAAPRCRGARAADWRDGWLVFVDLGARGRRDDSDTLLRVQPPLEHSGGMAGTRGTLSFTAAGFSTDGSSHFLFMPPPEAAADAPPAVLVCVSKQGRPRLATSEVCA